MRASLILLAVAAAGLLGGAFLAAGLAGLGGALMAESVVAGALALLRDDGRAAESEVPSPVSTLERFRRSA